ncbi:hypothetical protein OED52_13555 [Rhodococcus sp. Z13]|uniref:Uncharacterized protein n=1 Tax=Rhodococcus sacchari TaxID=2962047 RepID=A0ACD4DCH7_9NOCA|nr:hypothetical protein [Rhodococcus sp. Z13]UYP17697.1 hypothetical protein OED52_13555 [Rhodococcus sp. Z13]
MKHIVTYWDAIRQALYSLFALACAVAVGAKLFTESEAAQYLSYAAMILSAIGNVLASFYVGRTSPVQEQRIEQAVQIGIEKAAQPQAGEVAPAPAAVEETAGYVDPFIR